MINRLRTAFRMVTHWTTGAMLVSLGSLEWLVPAVFVYVCLQIATLILDFISPPRWKDS
jgi:hypothetical protein